MNKTSIMAVALLLGASGGGFAAEEKMSHVHVGHVLTGWGDTPDGAGLLTTAMKEAGIALKHAELAAKKPQDLPWLKTHTRHVMHALDPESVEQGPGLGYGLLRAARGAAKHINAAAGSADASDNVKTHAVHVATSARNAIARAEQMMKLARAVEASQSATAAADLVSQIQVLAGQVIKGRDANGDGTVTWHENEGGLNTSYTHAGILARQEGLPGGE